MRTASALAAALLKGERRALSKAITLVESTRPASRESADELLSLVLPHRDRLAPLRIGISGAPGTGKSTLIESLGLQLADRGHTVAVLAVDPSSYRSGGSVLGDKTRMLKLSSDPRAYIRPSPARGVLGGVARHTEDVALLCESAGYDRVIVETVGVGQSEVVVAGLVDLFLLLIPPAAGDGLQGIKRGIMELADLIVVTKCDGGLEASARAVAEDVRAAVRVLRPRDSAWAPRVMTSSSHNPQSAAAVAEAIEEFHSTMASTGALQLRRKQQASGRVWEHARAELLDRIHFSPGIPALVSALAAEAAEGRIACTTAGKKVAQAVLATDSQVAAAAARETEALAARGGREVCRPPGGGGGRQVEAVEHVQ